MKRIFFISIFVIFFYGISQGQVEVQHNYDGLGEAWFTAYNNYDSPVFLVIDFLFLNYTQFEEDLPYIKKIEPGANDLFVLRKATDQNIEFNYTYKWFMAHPKPTIDASFPYLFPMKPSKSTAVFHLSNSGKFIGQEIYGKWYSIGFTVEKSGSICASRGGQVIKIIENIEEIQHVKGDYQRVSNLVRILHNDGTVAEYYGFGQNQVTCELGDKIYPGQPLGQVGKNGYVGFTLFHSDLKSGKYKILIPQFYVKGKIEELLVPGVYISEHPDEIIVNEMSKKERKSFLKNKK